MESIIYIGNFDYMFGNAAGKRVLGNAKLLSECGYKPVCIGLNKNRQDEKFSKADFDEIESFGINEKSSTDRLNWKNYFRMCTQIIGKYENVKAVILYGSISITYFNLKLVKWCKKNNILVIFDVVDWLTVDSNNIFLKLFRSFDISFAVRHVNKKGNNVIAISSYLEEYYKDVYTPVILPPLSVKKCSFEPRRDDTFRIIYAGIPFRKDKKNQDGTQFKDRIDKIILTIYKTFKICPEFVFDIYGITEADFLSVLNKDLSEEFRLIIEELGERIIFHGLSDSKVIDDAVKQADFSILIRDVNRMTTAGFSTKISESVSLGTPVITNNTSDVKKYIEDGRNGFVCSEDDMPELIAGLVMRSKEENLKMKEYCCSNNIFYYKNYIERIEKLFLNS